MYAFEYLSGYPFFREALEFAALGALHDALTGLIARPVMLRFIQSLIRDGTPFALALVDLDNFKSINDNYGHRTGDETLTAVAASLRAAVGESGVVGRYGGDEFLIVRFGPCDYDSVHAFLDSLYAAGGVFRRDLTIRSRTIFSTATIGCACFPHDADSFEPLFALIDKTLYRGKSKGRNCFILYVPEKHAVLEIPNLARRSLYDTLRAMAAGFDSGRETGGKLRRAFGPMRENLRMARLFWLDAGGLLRDLAGGEPARVELPGSLIRNGLCCACGLDELRRCCPALCDVLAAQGFDSVLLCEVSVGDRVRGWLALCPEVHTLHIWQEHECAAAFFLARLLAQELSAADQSNPPC